MNRQTMQDPLSKETRNWMDHRERKRAGLARAIHPDYPEAIVPCRSPFDAMLCAAEVWGVDYMDIHDKVQIWAIGSGPASPNSLPRVYWR